MGMKDFAGRTFVPTLSRVVLGLAFSYAGYTKVLQNAEFNADQAAILVSYGVDVKPVDETPDVVPASYRQDSPDDQEDQESEQTAPDEETSSDAPPAGNPEGGYPALPEEVPVDDEVQDAPVETERSPDPGSETSPELPEDDTTSDGAPVDAADDAADAETPIVLDPDTMYTARGLHNITLMCHNVQQTRANPDDPAWDASIANIFGKHASKMAWAAGLTELVGGVLLLLGLFTWLWGLGLASTMVVAFWMTSLPMIANIDGGIFGVAIPGQFNTLYIQLAFFVMSFGLVFTGAGPISLDRVIFGRVKPSHVIDD
ncbi:MAG: DoxX family membrane protein [Planctomycetota bacterium]